jgi:hypothetical protein
MSKDELSLRRRLRQLLRDIKQVQEETDWHIEYSPDHDDGIFFVLDNTADGKDTEAFLERNPDKAFRICVVSGPNKTADPPADFTRTPALKQIWAETTDEVLRGPCEISPESSYVFWWDDDEPRRPIHIWVNPKELYRQE